MSRLVCRCELLEHESEWLNHAYAQFISAEIEIWYMLKVEFSHRSYHKMSTMNLKSNIVAFCRHMNCVMQVLSSTAMAWNLAL